MPNHTEYARVTAAAATEEGLEAPQNAPVSAVPAGYVDPGTFYEQAGHTIMFTSVESAQVVVFRAALTSFSDQFISNWQRENAFGRMDPIQAFQNTQ